MAAAKKSKKRKQKLARARRRKKSAAQRRRQRQGRSQSKKAGIPYQEEVRMSAVLERFIEPYLDAAETEHALQSLVALGAAAWNVALTPKEEHQAAIDTFVKAGLKGRSRQDRRDMEEILKELIERKLALFDDNKRFIVNFELVPDGDDHQLLVASIPPQSEIPSVSAASNPL